MRVLARLQVHDVQPPHEVEGTPPFRPDRFYLPSFRSDVNVRPVIQDDLPNRHGTTEIERHRFRFETGRAGNLVTTVDAVGHNQASLDFRQRTHRTAVGPEAGCLAVHVGDAGGGFAAFHLRGYRSYRTCTFSRQRHGNLRIGGQGAFWNMFAQMVAADFLYGFRHHDEAGNRPHQNWNAHQPSEPDVQFGQALHRALLSHLAKAP